MITRRKILKTGAAALAGGALPHWLHAGITLGDVQIDVVSDGTLTLPRGFITGPMPEDEVTDILEAHDITGDSFTPDCNLTLLRDGTNTVIFDAGSGPNFMPTAGKLIDALDAIGVSPKEVTHVLFTHGHPDHLWGALDDFDEPFFVNATHMMGWVEKDYWMNPETVIAIEPARQAFAAGALRMLMTLDDYGQLESFDHDAEVLPGIAARLFPGHTPGHVVFDITAGNETVTVIGDVIGNHHVAFVRPEWPSGSDQDPGMGAQSRVQLIEDLANSGNKFIGFHLPNPGIGTVERADTGYRFVPA